MTERFEFEAGSGVARGLDDPSMLLVGTALNSAIKWVTLPDNLGGGRVDVVDVREGDCPCGKHRTHILGLAATGPNNRPLCVCECAGGQYLWFVLPEEP